MTSEFKAELTRRIPGAKVVGTLADLQGYLIHVASACDAREMKQIERTLIAMGVTGWHWSATGQHIAIRAYTEPARAGCTLWYIAALVAVIAYCYDDIHSIAKIADLGSYSPW